MLLCLSLVTKRSTCNIFVIYPTFHQTLPQLLAFTKILTFAIMYLFTGQCCSLYYVYYTTMKHYILQFDIIKIIVHREVCLEFQSKKPFSKANQFKEIMDLLKYRRNSARSCLKVVRQYQAQLIKVQVKQRVKHNFRRIHSARAVTKPLLIFQAFPLLANDNHRPKSKEPGVRPNTAKPGSSFIHKKGISHQLMQGNISSKISHKKQERLPDQQKLQNTHNSVCHLDHKALFINSQQDSAGNAMRESLLISKFIQNSQSKNRKVCSFDHSQRPNQINKKEFLKKNVGTKRKIILNLFMCQARQQNQLANREDWIRQIACKLDQCNSLNRLNKGRKTNRQDFSGSAKSMISSQFMKNVDSQAIYGLKRQF